MLRIDCMSTLSQREKFGRYIAARREELDMTQEELAEAMGRSPGWVGTVERGGVERPKTPTMEALAAALKVPLIDLYIESGQIPASVRASAISALERIETMQTRAERKRAYRALPEPAQRAVLLLMQDIFLDVAERQEGSDQQ